MILPILLLSLDISDATQLQKSENVTINRNWTTCEEFLEGTSFNASRILDKHWKVFYTWNIHHEDPYHVKFREPISTLIDRFKAEVGNSSWAPNWNDTAFYMETTMDLSALFIKTSTPGMFKVITSYVFHYNLSDEVIFAMKVVDPGYLAFMNCKVQVVVALAPLNKFPKDEDLDDAADLINIRNPYGYPHNVHDAMSHFEPDENYIKAFEEDQIEVEVSSSMLE